ncbi:hypothetical protein ZWY2020_028478 [Hordeum vulgare]|nr:hypothetical protein ZWY2020_028478 [Hordeum vulgare]
MEPAPAPATASPDPAPISPSPSPTKRSTWKKPCPSSAANGAPHADAPPPPAIMDANQWPALADTAKTKTLLSPPPTPPSLPRTPPPPSPPPPHRSDLPFPSPLLPSLSRRWCLPAFINMPSPVSHVTLVYYVGPPPPPEALI